MAPMVFMPLLRETCPSGPNMIIKNISTKVFRCKLLDDVMRYAGVRCTRRGDAMRSQGMDVDLLSWYANYFTRFCGETEMRIPGGSGSVSDKCVSQDLTRSRDILAAIRKLVFWSSDVPDF